MAKKHGYVVIEAGTIARDGYRTLVAGGTYGPRRARLTAGEYDLGGYAQEQVGDDEARLTFHATLESPYQGPLGLVYGHPDEPVTERIVDARLPAGEVEVEIVLQFA